MKKLKFYDVFLVFAIILNIGTKSVYASIILICAGILELAVVIPKIARYMKRDGK